MSTAVAERSPAVAVEHNRDGGPLSHREILEVMIGLLAALFTALISSTIVSTALPTIMSDLHGTQRQYTWVITASLLAMTISTPIMGKLADLLNKKLLIQLSIILFVLGSVGAGLSQEIWQMMVARAAQGVAMGGLTAMTQAIMGSIIAPRERGRYSGYMGAVMAVATVSGPLVGGWITQSWSWRWVFFVCVPLAVISLILLQAKMHLPTRPKRKVKIDYFGAFFLACAAAAPMMWVTFAGSDYDWISWQSGLFLAAFVVAAGVAIIIEFKHPEPIVPIRVIANSTTALMIIAGLGVGVGMFGAGTFLTQYFQLGAGYGPTKAGLMTLPMIVAQLFSSVIGGQIVSRTGRWKPVMVVGAILFLIGFGGLGYFLDHNTPYWQIAMWVAIGGIGVGAMLQNIVLAVQNTVDVKDIGASSATVSFFRSLGGAVGVTVLGAVLATKVPEKITAAFSSLSPAQQVKAGVEAAAMKKAGMNLDINSLAEPLRTIVHHAYGDTFGLLFLIAAIIGIASFICVVAVHEVPLRTTVELHKPADPAGGAAAAAVPAAEELAAVSAAPNVARVVDHQSAVPATNLSANLSADLSTSGDTAPAMASVADPADVDSEDTALAASSDWDPSGLDDPAERVSVAALDVLTAAQDRARAQEALGHDKINELMDKLNDLSHEVDAAIGGFHRQVQEMRDQLLSAEPQRHAPGPDGAGGDELRQYEYNLLLDSQQAADRVTRLARAEAERTLAQAEQERSELEKRIEQLRGVERELTGRVTEQLRLPGGDHQQG